MPLTTQKPAENRGEDDLSLLKQGFLQAIRDSLDIATLEEVRVAALGKKGRITDLMKTLGALAPEARKVLAVGSTGTYARFGENDDQGSAVGLAKWRLLCPRFHQYPFQPASILDESLKCAENAQVLIVSESFGSTPKSPTWNEFVAGAQRLLQNYSCDSPSGARACTRRWRRFGGPI